MKGEQNKLYTNPEDYFELEGSFVMMLSGEAAEKVCRIAASRGSLIGRIEGGMWRNPGFESRLDCIWNGLWPPSDFSYEQAHMNNQTAADFIEASSIDQSAFILTSGQFENKWNQRGRNKGDGGN